MIRFDNVSFQYEASGYKAGVENISFCVRQGECLLLCGRSGSGKTTITKLLNGLIPNFEKGELSGQITICGLDISGMPQYEIARHVACVFQNPKSQFFNSDTESELTFGLENLSVPVDEINDRLRDSIQELHLEALLDKSLFSMSGGEKQLIAFAAAYMSGAEIIVLDEPSANLDMAAIERIRGVIEKMKRRGKTIVISEHRLAFLHGIADSVCCLDGGKMVRYLPADQFFSISEEERVRLGLRALATDNELHIAENQNTGNKELLRVESLMLSYKKNTVIKDMSFSCREGEVVGICGRNGVGKTTLLRCLCGLHKQERGTVYIGGAKSDRHKRQRQCGLVMQDVNYQLFSDSVEGECRLGTPNVSDEQVAEILRTLSLTAMKDRHPQSLSGGQKQRLAIAVTYLCRKKVVLLDEPTSGLDYENMLAVSGLLKRLSTKGIVCIAVSHDAEFLNACCGRLIRIGE